MIESRIRSALSLLIIVALICIVFINLPSMTTISIVLKMTDLRPQPEILKRDSVSANRIEDVEYLPLRDFSKRFLDEYDPNGMNYIKIEGKINSSRNYAIFSIATDCINARDYIFYMPLTTLAWKRIGFDSVILVIGSSNDSFSDPLIRYVLSRCLELDAVLLYIYSPPTNAATVSQVAKLFAPNILSAKFPDTDWVYLITADVDFWPLNPDSYRLRSDMAMLSVTVNCCTQFVYNGVSYKTPVASNIGMRVMTWNRLLLLDSFKPNYSQNILRFLRREFGSLALHRIRKNENLGWYLYQLRISFMMKDWINEYGISHVMLLQRKTAVDRLECCRLKGDSSFDGKVDVHMPLKGFHTDIWKSIIPLLRTMYDYQSERYNWSLSYYEYYADYTIRK